MPTHIRKRVLFHLPFKLVPVYYGAQSRAVGFLQYFKDRREYLSVDMVTANQSLKESWITPRWDLEQTQEALKYVDNVFVYEGRKNFIDFFYTRSKIAYYQLLLRQQLPVDTDYYSPPGYVKFVQNLAAKQDYDFALINTVNFAALAQPFKGTPTCTLVDIHDISCRLRQMLKDVLNFKNLAFDYDLNFSKEVRLLDKFDAVITNSSYESSNLSSFLSPDKIHDIQHFVGGSNPESGNINYKHRDFKYDLLFIGMANVQNIDGLNFFLESIFPKIIAAQPDIHLAIAGKVCADAKIGPELVKNVSLLGYVPDLSELYLKTRIMVCPLRTGSGSNVKLFEAMSYSLPIVTTQHCASALLLENECNALFSDDPDQYSDYVIQLLEDPQLAHKLSEQISMTYQMYYSKSAIYAQFDKLFGI